MYDGKKDKTKDYSLGLHGAAMNGNVGKEVYKRFNIFGVYRLK